MILNKNKFLLIGNIKLLTRIKNYILRKYNPYPGVRYWSMSILGQIYIDLCPINMKIMKKYSSSIFENKEKLGNNIRISESRNDRNIFFLLISDREPDIIRNRPPIRISKKL